MKPGRDIRKLALASAVAAVLPCFGSAAVLAQEQDGSIVFPPPGLRTSTLDTSAAPTTDQAAAGESVVPAEDVAAGESALPDAPEPQLSAFSSVDSGASPEANEALVNPFAPVQQVVKSPQEIEEEIREKAFNAAITGLLPMRPGEIRTMLERFDETQQAVEIPIYPYPKPEVVVQTVSLDPGAVPPTLKVGVGHVSTLTFVDVSGAPWPIQDISWAGNFEIINPEAGGNILRITPMSDFAYGNMSIRLLKLTTPVTFIIKTHRDSIHYRFDARVSEFGPFAEAPIVEGGFTLVAGDSILNGILDGVPPDGAERLDVVGTDGRTSAYKFKENTYVRTPLTLLSPGWSSSVSSADGMNVYRMASAPVVLLSDRGSMVRAKLQERGTGDDSE